VPSQQTCTRVTVPKPGAASNDISYKGLLTGLHSHFMNQ
jgi:hypothetical protein